MLRRVYLPNEQGPRKPHVIPGRGFRLVYEEKTEGTLYIFGKRAQDELKKQKP